MEKQKHSVHVERRASERIRDGSTLLVGGQSSSGTSFVERTKIHNISAGGVSFWLEAETQRGDLLEVSFWSEDDDSPALVASVKLFVLRVVPNCSLFLVAGEFQNEFVTFAEQGRSEDIARNLELAVKSDELARADSLEQPVVL